MLTSLDLDKSRSLASILNANFLSHSTLLSHQSDYGMSSMWRWVWVGSNVALLSTTKHWHPYR